MTIKNLINTDIIIGIIQKLGNRGRKFKSEAQFQFELAWALKKYLQEQDCENKPEVILPTERVVFEGGEILGDVFEAVIRHRIPEFDFYQEILSNGEDIEVLEPKWMRDEIGGIINRMWNKYKND